MSTLAVNTITNAAGGNTAQINGMTPTADSLQGFRNRIINGDMRIDQRNAGASVTPTNLQYTVDRWAAGLTQSSKFSVQQNAGAVTPPAGFTNYIGVTSLSAYAITTSDIFNIQQRVEGFNVADFGWGTANAQAVTLSFWVRSSLTGTFGGSFVNNAFNRSYPFSYTISAANTWEQKSITIPGDTTGTWLTNNGTGLFLFFGLGVGSTQSGTAGAWSGSGFYGATGAVSVVGTSGATFYITGVQLEAGSVATPFERRPYGTELQLAMRYYWNMVSTGAPYMPFGGVGTATGGATASIPFSSPVTMRVVPSVSASTGSSLILSNDAIGLVAVPTTGVSVFYVGHPTNYQLAFTTAAAALTANRPYSLFAYNNASMSVNFSAELDRKSVV
jgi:hypothetical protein